MCRCLLVLLLAGTVSGLVIQRQQPNCTLITDIFRFKNITLQLPDEAVNDSVICGNQVQCCSSEMEAMLQTTVAHDLHSLLYHNFHSVHGMLESTQAALADEVRRVSEASENMTLSIFAEVYKGMWNEVRQPVRELYQTLSAFLERGRKIPIDLPPAVPSEDATTLQGYVSSFFRQLFPLVYQETVHSLESNVSSISEEYAACLMKSADSIRPFSHFPEDLGSKVAKSYETTKVLLQALSLGLEVLNVTDHVMSTMPENTDSCRKALLRLYYCPKCQGLPSKVKPCIGYCLNVMRGCLTQQRTTELDLPWSNFLVEVEKLVRQVGDQTGKIPSIDAVLFSFSSVISDAIMYASLNGPGLEKMVKSACGPPKLVTRSTPEPLPEEMVTPKKPTDEGPVAKQLRLFTQAIETTKARGFFANLAEALCSDDSFAETRDTAECWNGHRIGEYTKPLVRPGLDAQRYNPELNWTETVADPSMRHLSDKLRHMRQVVLSHLHHDRPSPMPDSLTAGSGSGGSDWWDDERDDSGRNDEGSGSGDGPDAKINAVDSSIPNQTNPPTVKTTGAAFELRSSLPLIIFVLSASWIM